MLPSSLYSASKASNATLRGTLIFMRRTDTAGRAHLLGRSFDISSQWLHRLVRCEVDLSGRRIRFYALRRRAPDEQPLLRTVPYRLVIEPFKEG